MTSQRMTDAPVPVGEHVPRADQFVMLGQQSWDAYERLLELRGEHSRPQMAYLDGVVQLMSPSFDHETISRIIAILVGAYCAEKNISFRPAGSWTHKAESEEAGLEPDECFVFGSDRKERADLAIEVVWTRGGIQKLEIYRRLHVREVWVWKTDAITVHVLGPEGYAVVERSTWLPDLDLALICRLVLVESTSDAIRQLRDAVRG